MTMELVALEPFEPLAISSDALYEVLDGEIVEKPPMGTRQELMAGILYLRLGHFVEMHKLGWAVVETLFDFTKQVGHKRRPDLAFVSEQRWPRSKAIPERDGWQVVPDLAIEVVSPSNSWDEVLDKVQEYFQVGVRRVWVVSGPHRQVHVFSSPTEVRIFARTDTLDDAELLPGFRLPVAEVFTTERDASGNAVGRSP